MKKTTILFVFLLLLSACTPSDTTGTDHSTINPTTETPAKDSDIHGPGSVSDELVYMRNWYGYTNAQGFYYLFEDVDSIEVAANLMYIDFATGGNMVLCIAPGCSHKQADCTGYVPFEGGAAYLPTNAALYHVTKGHPGFEAGDDFTSPARVDTLNLDGTGRSNITTFAQEQDIVFSSFVCSDSQLYYIAMNNEEHDLSQFALYVLDFASGATIQLLELGYEDKIVGVFENAVVVQQIVVEEENYYSWEEWENSFTLVAQDGTVMHSPVSVVNKDIHGGVLGGNFYGYEFDTGNVVGYNLVTGEKSILFEEALPGQPTYELVYFEYLTPKLFTLKVMELLENGDAEYYTYIVDTMNGRMQQMELPGGPYDAGIEIIADLGDRYFALVGSEFIPAMLPADDGTLYEYEVMRSNFGFISKEDFWNNNPNYQMIKNPTE